MNLRFRNRTEAGELLARKLRGYAHRPDVIVLALPRGGVPVARVVARHLRAPLDVFIVRKLGVPGHEELAMGAIASGGVKVLNQPIIDAHHIRPETIERIAEREHDELIRREQAYRDDRPPPALRGRTVILVDDGIATGATMRAAVKALRMQKPARIIVATPTVAHSTYLEMLDEVDDFVAVIIPEAFSGVGEWFDDFSQTSDDEVRELLKPDWNGHAAA